VTISSTDLLKFLIVRGGNYRREAEEAEKRRDEGRLAEEEFTAQKAQNAEKD
jgi:hypothetical protein